MITSIATAQAVPKKMCVFDLLGANGPFFAQMKDYKTVALAWGVELELKPYTSERVAAEDFKAGLCDAVSFTGIRARQFNSFTGTLDAIGAMPSYDHLKSVITTISGKKAAKLMFSGPYEVVAIYPAGAGYMFVNDRSIDTVGELAGKRIAILDSDPAQVEMVNFIGGSPVSASIATMYSKFNNGSVDVTYGPAIVYEAMELYKGLEPNGGIIKFSLVQLTIQILIRKTDFPEGYGQKSREFALSQFDLGVEQIKKYENTIPAKMWISVPEVDVTGYLEVFRQSRIRLRDKGIYNGKMLKLMRMLRCKKDPQQPECTAADKE
ncbi:putative solute-binding protein [Bathymodiolus platifrons methanotrophic gill symbiont]|nr:putative solute-binding protein [Bathymodiolus platifrons methanotrophic gill symbiont]